MLPVMIHEFICQFVVLAAGNWVLLALAAPPPAFPAVVATTTSVPPATAPASHLTFLPLRQIYEGGSGLEQAVCGAPNKRKMERELLLAASPR